MFCTNCGSKVADGAAFCTNCGSRLEQPKPVAPAPEPVIPAPEPQQNSLYQPEPEVRAPAAVQPEPAPQVQNSLYRQEAAPQNSLYRTEPVAVPAAPTSRPTAAPAAAPAAVQEPVFRPEPAAEETPRRYAPQQQPAYQPPQRPTVDARSTGAPAAAAQRTLPNLPAPKVQTRGAFMKLPEGKGARTLSLMAVIVMLMALAVAAFGYYHALTDSLFDMPAVDLAIRLSGEDAEELIDGLTDSYEELVDRYEDNKYDIPKDQQEMVEALLEGMEGMIEKTSLLSLRTLTVELAKVDLDSLNMDESEEKETRQQINQVKLASDIAIYAIMALFALPLLLILLGGLGKKTGTTVAAMVFTLLFALPTCSTLLVGVTFGILLVQAILCGCVNRAFKKYLRS